MKARIVSALVLAASWPSVPVSARSPTRNVPAAERAAPPAASPSRTAGKAGAAVPKAVPKIGGRDRTVVPKAEGPGRGASSPRAEDSAAPRLIPPLSDGLSAIGRVLGGRRGGRLDVTEDVSLVVQRIAAGTHGYYLCPTAADDGPPRGIAAFEWHPEIGVVAGVPGVGALVRGGRVLVHAALVGVNF